MADLPAKKSADDGADLADRKCVYNSAEITRLQSK